MNFFFFFFCMFIFLMFLLMLNFKETFYNDTLIFLNQKEFSNLTFFFLEYNLNSILFLIGYIFLSLICIINLIYLMKDKGSIMSV